MDKLVIMVYLFNRLSPLQTKKLFKPNTFKWWKILSGKGYHKSELHRGNVQA